MSNRQEWKCQTNPTNPESVLRLSVSISGTNVNLRWDAVSAVPYYLQRSTNLGSSGAFMTVRTNVLLDFDWPGYAVTDNYQGAAAVLSYRLGIGD
jgi:hypothetical protein